uniref:SMODS and SLOG-associating 2TM effector domain-containing protein n=1 Tax=Candidatus Kentrum sp. TUN TaxID=2126343 RepID=A0A450ZBS2_9GAMM|nr:MAG: hypothetical protein BECKTUN1418D_GA0071000_100625 [Candidatus Kentron sp. TUN]
MGSKQNPPDSKTRAATTFSPGTEDGTTITGTSRGLDNREGKTETPAEEIDGLLFDCERLSIYHAIRRNFLDKCHRISLFLVVLSGTTAFSFVMGRWEMDWLTMFPALFGLANLVFDFAGQSRIHESVYRRICALSGDILADPDAEKNIGRWQKEIHGIYAEDPAIYRALEAWAYNLACNGRGKTEHHFIIPQWHFYLKNIWPFLSHDYASKEA